MARFKYQAGEVEYMCITAAGKILSINGNRAIVDIDGTQQEVRIDLVKANVGEYVYCASGMAIERADERADA